MSKQQFNAKLMKDPEAGGWTIFNIPFDVEKTFGQKGYVKVKGNIDEYTFSGIKLMPLGNGTHCMAVKEAIRKAIGKEAGETITVSMEIDKSELPVSSDFSNALEENSEAKAFFTSLSESNKSYYVNWITGAKKEETRQLRVEKTIERLSLRKVFGDK